MSNLLKLTACFFGGLIVCMAAERVTLAASDSQLELWGQQFSGTATQGSFTVAVMSDELKFKPKEIDPSVSGGSLCMEKYRSYYENYGRKNAPPPPQGSNPSCIRCLSDRAEVGRPFSDAVRYCKSRCCE